MRLFKLFAFLSLLYRIFIFAADIPPELQNLPYGIYPSNPAIYNTQRFNYNKRFNVFPKAIFAPTTNDEIAYVLSVLKQNNLQFAIRSGGHCYEPGSLSSDYMIDLQNFNAITLDIPNSQVRFGAGCRFMNIFNTLGPLNYAIPAGTCPGNCINGYTLGGGIGLLVRGYGLGCDSVRSFTLLNADSEVIEVNENNYPDLFWALRGGGSGSFGIVLDITYKMYYIPAVTYFSLKWEWDPETFPKIFKAWQKWVLTLPNSISTIARINYENGRVIFNVTGLKSNSEPFTEWEYPFKKFNPTTTFFQGTYLDSSQFWAGQSNLPFNKGKSKIMMEPLSSKVIKKIVNHFQVLLKNKPQLNVLFEFEALGGVVPDFTTAFFPRNAFGWWYQETLWGNEDITKEALAYSNDFYDRTSPYVSKYSYANTVDYDLGRHYLKAYYGDHVSRLIRAKRKYDPENLFHWRQSIPLSKKRTKKKW